MIIKTKKFDRWARKTALTDASLRMAVEEMVEGLIDADLGGGVFAINDGTFLEVIDEKTK